MLHTLFKNLALNEEDYIRYSRHLLLPQISFQGQKKLKNAKVLCIGAGGLGSIVLMYLAAVGVGTIGIVDYDNVELSNLQRQIIHSHQFLEKSKTNSAVDTLNKINPSCDIIPYNLKLASHNILEILYPYDIVIDGTDNFETKYLVNDACVILNKPNVYGAIFQFEGQVSVFNYRGGPNYRDIYPIIPSQDQVPSCAEAGVIGVLPGIIGVLQATETIKIILGIGEILSKRLLIYDALKTSFYILRIKSSININNEYLSLGKAKYFNKNMKPFNKILPVPKITVKQLRNLIETESRPFLIIDVRTKQESLMHKIQDSICLPLNQLETSRNLKWIDSQSKNKDIILHCKTGQRSARAIHVLAQHGIYAYHLEGGIVAWERNINKSWS